GLLAEQLAAAGQVDDWLHQLQADEGQPGTLPAVAGPEVGPGRAGRITGSRAHGRSFGRHCCILTSRRLKSTGLLSKSLHPADFAFSLSWAMERAVKAMMGMASVPGWARICRVASRPSSGLGSPRSIRIRSG